MYNVCMQSKATTVEAYLRELPADRREAIETVRAVILKNLDKQYSEGMGYGMIGYAVPHSVYPAGYHCNPKQPLPFAGIASQKNYMSLYLMSLYGDGETGSHWEWFNQAWAKTGKKLDMGKCCIRFKKVEDLALDVIGEAIKRVPAQKYIEYYESAIKNHRSNMAARSATKASTKSGSGTGKAKASAAKTATKSSGKTGAAKTVAKKKVSKKKAAK